jgi:hypothetical protein
MGVPVVSTFVHGKQCFYECLCANFVRVCVLVLLDRYLGAELQVIWPLYDGLFEELPGGFPKW